MIALVSAKGSPGVTVSGLAFALTWSGRTLLVEADPAGGDVLSGYLQGSLDAQRGLAQLAVAELRGRLRDEFERQLVDLAAPRRQRLLLPGLRDPAQAATVAPVWPAIADFLRQLAEDGSVIVDCGRLTAPHFGWPLLHAADQVLLVVRGTLSSVSHAVPAVGVLRKEQAERGGPDRLGLLVVDTGPYPAAEVAARLQVDLAAVLPADQRSARVLSSGGQLHLRSPLLRSAAATQQIMASNREVVDGTRAG
ncbi:ParA family protein [Natronosporangium hydrolyticum]|uniref:ParA family protein n=1 Tax=Natronosporangium hydrolyticum TaxID=2811111 RepID=A0A895YFN5_9ACTN|nr:ParA family protein [Natronosporangium hydrolyticum]QSB14922.1 ParA family protein [Natronosporangium hydrolyticum]